MATMESWSRKQQRLPYAMQWQFVVCRRLPWLTWLRYRWVLDQSNERRLALCNCGRSSEASGPDSSVGTSYLRSYFPMNTSRVCVRGDRRTIGLVACTTCVSIFVWLQARTLQLSFKDTRRSSGSASGLLLYSQVWTRLIMVDLTIYYTNASIIHLQACRFIHLLQGSLGAGFDLHSTSLDWNLRSYLLRIRSLYPGGILYTFPYSHVDPSARP